MISTPVLCPNNFASYTVKCEVKYKIENKFLAGDMDCNGTVDLLDVAPFVLAVNSPVFEEKADMNGDGMVNLLDVDLFTKGLEGIGVELGCN